MFNGKAAIISYRGSSEIYSCTNSSLTGFGAVLRQRSMWRSRQVVLYMDNNQVLFAINTNLSRKDIVIRGLREILGHLLSTVFILQPKAYLQRTMYYQSGIQSTLRSVFCRSGLYTSHSLRCEGQQHYLCWGRHCTIFRKSGIGPIL